MMPWNESSGDEWKRADSEAACCVAQNAAFRAWLAMLFAPRETGASMADELHLLGLMTAEDLVGARTRLDRELKRRGLQALPPETGAFCGAHGPAEPGFSFTCTRLAGHAGNHAYDGGPPDSGTGLI